MEFCIVLSGGFDSEDQLTPAHIQYKNGRGHQVTELTFDYEEADWRVIPHLDWNIRHQQNLTTSVVVSKDTDILVYFIHYMSAFRAHGMKELWMLTESEAKNIFFLFFGCMRRLVYPCVKHFWNTTLEVDEII